jgi:hypothetical protein
MKMVLTMLLSNLGSVALRDPLASKSNLSVEEDTKMAKDTQFAGISRGRGDDSGMDRELKAVRQVFTHGYREDTETQKDRKLRVNIRVKLEGKSSVTGNDGVAGLCLVSCLQTQQNLKHCGKLLYQY